MSLYQPNDNLGVDWLQFFSSRSYPGNNSTHKQRLAALLIRFSTHLLGGISVEKSSTSVSARSTAFMPLVQSRLSQNMQFTWVTHLFLKLAFDVDIVVLLKMGELSRFFCPQTANAAER